MHWCRSLLIVASDLRAAPRRAVPPYAAAASRPAPEEMALARARAVSTGTARTLAQTPMTSSRWALTRPITRSPGRYSRWRGGIDNNGITRVMHTDQSLTVSAWVRLGGSSLAGNEHPIRQVGQTAGPFSLGYDPD